MTDVPSSLGIEAVECLAEGGRSVTVRVTGRWRRRRPELRGQPMLVVDAESGRQRFLAMPEPPSLTGAAPGTWRMSFSVPAAMAPSLPGRTFLQLGGAMVPLPIGDVPIPAESARRQVTDRAVDIARLERELDDARAQSERLRAEIGDRERRLRSVEQHVHSERAERVEAEQQLSLRSRAAQHDLRVLHERVAELERELSGMRRAVDEAQHLTAAAEAARAHAVRRLAAATAPTLRELELLRAGPRTATAVVLSAQAERPGDGTALRLETAMAGRRATLADTRVADLERELAAAREEVDAQRRRAARAYEAIDLVRAELRRLQAPGLPVAGAPPPRGLAQAEPVQAERLSAALARLREEAPAGASEPPPETTVVPAVQSVPAPWPVKPWLAPAFRTLTSHDASAAGRLLLALLPAQPAADSHPVAYDLIISELLVAHVTVASGGHVALDATPRQLVELDFQLSGDLASIARLLAAGPVRRRLLGLVPTRRVARVRGDRRRLTALDHLIGARLTVGQLQAAGVELDPLLAMTLAGLMIHPAWTTGERFTIAHRERTGAAPDAYLHIRDGEPPLPSVTLPHGRVASVVVCPAAEVLSALAGAAGALLEGEERPLALLRQWLERAQSA